MAQCLVGGSRPDAVGIEALVEYETLIVGLVVQIDTVARDMNLAHAHVGGDAVHSLALGILHLIGEVVEEGILGRP